MISLAPLFKVFLSLFSLFCCLNVLHREPEDPPFVFSATRESRFERHHQPVGRINLQASNSNNSGERITRRA